ncbi:MAG: response regulator transcription factor [Pseudomonadota bacterium]
MQQIRIVIADDHEMVRDGLRLLLSSRVDGADVVAEASNGREAVRLIRDLGPDIVLMDVSMPELNGFEAVKRITRDHPSVNVIALSMHDSKDYVTRMMGAGAKAYVLKESVFEDLHLAIEAVLDDQIFLSARLINNVLKDYCRLAMEKSVDAEHALSRRETEVLQLVAEGNRTTDISEKLSISVKTVESHRAQILRKLELDGIAALTRFAIQKGIVSI